MALNVPRRLRLIAVGGLVALSLAAPMAVAADTGGLGIAARYSNHATADIVGVTFDSKLMVSVRIAVVCDPFEAFDWATGEVVLVEDGQIGASATVIQAQGRTIVGTMAFASQAVHCDGTTVNLATIPVVASSAPFRRGDALAGTQLDVCEVPFGSCWANASSGPTEIRLGR